MATAAGAGAGFLQPTFKRAARIWWAWVWRSLVFGGAAGLFGSLVLNLSGILNRISEKAAQCSAGLRRNGDAKISDRTRNSRCRADVAATITGRGGEIVFRAAQSGATDTVGA